MQGEVSDAIEAAMTAALAKADLPKLTVGEYASLVTLNTVCVALGLDDQSGRIKGLLEGNARLAESASWQMQGYLGMEG